MQGHVWRSEDGFSLEDRKLLSLVAQGLTNRAIGLHLGFTPDTIKKRLMVLADHMDIPHGQVNRARMVAVAFRKGLIY